jgi:three-Cys-motif partner protein
METEMSGFKFDVIGYWSEIKLDIIREYAQAYSRILTTNKLHHVYIDAFAGAGTHVSKTKGDFISGSPLNALLIKPPFRAFHLIDLDSGKAEQLRQLAADNKDAHIYEGDCNEILLRTVFPQVQYAQYRRGLCLLDPYGLHLDWRVIETAGKMKSLEIFLNFPVADMNRNVLWRDVNSVDPSQAERLTAFWGDESWKQAAYDASGNLFGWKEKQSNDAVAKAFQARLKNVAGFRHVLDPMPMRNTKGAIIYYLFFASPKPVAAKIVKDIFAKYAEKGVT